MNSHAYEQFFLKPGEPLHRRYETLRAVFVDQQPMKEVAERFQVHYGTVRKWASEFRSQQDSQQTSPFFWRHHAAVPPIVPMTKRPSSTPM